MNKKERLEKIRRFVNDFEIGTQEEIVTYLRQSGIKIYIFFNFFCVGSPGVFCYLFNTVWYKTK